MFFDICLCVVDSDNCISSRFTVGVVRTASLWAFSICTCDLITNAVAQGANCVRFPRVLVYVGGEGGDFLCQCNICMVTMGVLVVGNFSVRGAACISGDCCSSLPKIR